MARNSAPLMSRISAALVLALRLLSMATTYENAILDRRSRPEPVSGAFEHRVCQQVMHLPYGTETSCHLTSGHPGTHMGWACCGPKS